MEVKDHLRTTGGALKNWFIAQTYDALAVGAMWLVGLWIARVPLAPLWAVIGAICQFIPHIGPVISVIGPVLSGAISKDPVRAVYALIVYAIIVVIDGLLLQPYLMKRTVKVPILASIFVPIICGIVIPFWGVLLAPPALAVFYTYRAKRLAARNQPVPPPSAT